MDPDFWHQRWEDNNTPFHEGKVNGLLAKYLPAFALPKGARIFVPLCGKTVDIGWLAAQGFHAIGAELSEIAIKHLFEELEIEPEVGDEGPFRVYRAPDIEIFVGDVFDLTVETLGPIDLVYDRAALVALPEEMRLRYADHLADITGYARQLLLTFLYDQSKLDGPPFAFDESHVRQCYEKQFAIEHFERREIPDGLKGVKPAWADAWALSKS